MSPVVKLSDSRRGKWVEFYEVSSESRAGVAYVVAKDQYGQFGCSCPAWIFHTPRHDCKHIRRVQSYLMQPAPLQSNVQPILSKEKLEKILSRFSLVEV